MARWLVVFGIIGAYKSGLSEKYDNHTLLHIIPENAAQFDAVKAFKDPDGQIEIFKPSRNLNDSMDILVPPEKMDMMYNFTKLYNLKMRKQEHYGRKFDDSMPADRSPRRRVYRGNPAFEYQSFAAINDILEGLEKAHGDVLKLQYLGNSYEGRKLKLAKLSTNPKARNPVIFVDAGVHAREWVAPALALYMIHRLATDSASRRDMHGIDWYILPVVNPDGYDYTRTNADNRMWRKTRSQYTTSCYGVDANRNYGFKWAVSGVSLDPCDAETYAGPKPFSEKEAQLVRKVMVENSDRMKLYVSLHSYGQYLVYPWGYTGQRLPKTWRKLDRLAKIASASLVRAGGPPFKVMSAGMWYPAAGGSDDFAFGAVGVPYSYTMELTEGYEFIYPQNQLESILPKFYEAFRAMATEIKKEFSNPRQQREGDVVNEPDSEASEEDTKRHA